MVNRLSATLDVISLPPSSSVKQMGNEQGKVDGSSGVPPGMQTMGRQLQRRFAKGVQYDSELRKSSSFHLIVISSSNIQ